MGATDGVYLITDRRRSLDRPIEDVIAAAVAGGVSRVQVREKDLSTRALLALVRKVIACAGPARVFVNDRVDVALATGCGGVQLGASTLPVAEVRRVAPSLTIGYSAHGLEEARAAEKEGADFVTFSPVYETRSKGVMGSAPQGAARLAEVCRALEIPVYALGGVNAARAPEVLAAGAAGLAVVSAITEAPDVEKAARALADLTRAASRERKT